jgi:ubiquinone/menaquinone biosynthesis C-methylase UbiE
MQSRPSDSTRRFSDRVENYVRYRPGYPPGVLDVLREGTGLTPGSVVADVGSGTGISSTLFLGNGNPVLAVEPNAEMRAAAEARLGGVPGFRSIVGTAEATTLPDASVDQVVAGQAFHWFDPRLARREFARILRPGGWVVLIWNVRRTDATPFLREYEALLQRYGTDYARVRHENVGPAVLGAFYDGGSYGTRSLPNEQRFDLEALTGRLLSSSYTPTPDDPGFRPMLEELARIFERHAREGTVRFEYDTVIHFGHVSRERGG